MTSTQTATPFNQTTGKAYQGGNIMRLLVAAEDQGFDQSKGWAGFAQWLTVGRVVRKGQHGTPCLTIVKVGKPDAKGRRDSAPRGFRVFHFDQTEELLVK